MNKVRRIYMSFSNLWGMINMGINGVGRIWKKVRAVLDDWEIRVGRKFAPEATEIHMELSDEKSSNAKFDEQKDEVAVEQILRVVFLDVERPSPALEKLKRQLAEAEAELEAHKKPLEDAIYW
ncbi:vesicle-associated 4-2-like [Olea europaea subsp. europaea]|uniref:Vesicle-associated 4-2-like n=1 Tax=Olea europaea subsp. europaea TaxID=158383 RepID=A0A8S0UCN0_OLEEU|nr:vesicle-associated 4-2-like [Olea europaea subsp. europaea]